MKIASVIKDFILKAKQEAARNYDQSPSVKNIASPLSAEDGEHVQRGWIGIDLDGTLAICDSILNMSQIGSPVPKMINFVKGLIEKKHRVKIFTARASDPDQVQLVKKWLKENSLPDMEITNIKDFGMIVLYDDRAIQVITNTGDIVDRSKTLQPVG